MDVTVVIPTYNRREALLETLRTLERVEYPPASWEVVVVDDGSGDGTEAAVEEWMRGARVTARFLKQANAGPAAARNRGAAAARGDVLVFIDNDILVAPSFLRDHLAAQAAHPGCWVVGRITHPEELRRTPFGRYRHAVWEQFYLCHAAKGPVEIDGLSAANVSLPRADFVRLGGFDADFAIASCEDWELAFRAREAGVRILYHPGITVIHNDWAISLDRYCERQRLYSISDVLLWRKYGAASPRAALVRANAPVAWGADSPRRVIKKAAKRVLATGPGRWLLWHACRLAERAAPDTAWTRRAYDLAVAVAIFRGVREGLTRYPAGAGRAPRPAEDNQSLPAPA